MRVIKSAILIIMLLPILLSCGKKTTEPNQCAAPVLTPAGDTFYEPLAVYISTATEGATILYTTDGSEPTYSSPTYTDSILVYGNLTIKAKAVKSGWVDSQVVTSEYGFQTEMILVPGGTFTMGRTNGSGLDNELPIHSVTLPTFYIGKYEVAQYEWLAIMGSNPSVYVDLNKPVESINWYSVLVFCNKKSISEGLTPVYSINGSTNSDDWGAIPTSGNADWNNVTCNWIANGYRLPTEAEWEFAARGGSNDPDYLYSGSDNPDAVGWCWDNSGGTSHPRGTKQANGLGIYDMTGNIWEWCWDWYDYGYYNVSPSLSPTGPNSGSQKVFRGGCWYLPWAFSRVSKRDFDNIYYQYSYVGLRLVRSAV